MDKEAITKIIRKKTKDGKISCKQALKIAEEAGIPSKKLGALLNELKIKVANCQLGCFP